jgi:hypothetical protein
MIFGVEGVDPARRERLIRLLDIDLYQRLTTMSDGQRRRVQIAMGLLKPYDVGVGVCVCVGETGRRVQWGARRMQCWGEVQARAQAAGVVPSWGRCSWLLARLFIQADWKGARTATSRPRLPRTFTFPWP